MKLFLNRNDLKHGINLKIEFRYATIITFMHMPKEQKGYKMSSEISDTIVDTSSEEAIQVRQQRQRFSSEYKEQIFYLWYNNGKPPEHKLVLLIPENWDKFHRIPTVNGLKFWIDVEFVPRARILDSLIKEKMDTIIVAEKIEMLKRHANIGKNMQEGALKWLEENGNDLMNSSAAVRLLVEGIRIERESVGIPTSLEKIMHLSDEDLQKEVEKILTQGKLLQAENASANSGLPEQEFSASDQSDTSE